MRQLPLHLAVEMKVHLSADYQSETWFYPAYTLAGQLTSVELVTQFVHERPHYAAAGPAVAAVG